MYLNPIQNQCLRGVHRKVGVLDLGWDGMGSTSTRLGLRFGFYSDCTEGKRERREGKEGGAREGGRRYGEEGGR